jgi:LmbE family N-acetylglucosaminyl deacetylase
MAIDRDGSIGTILGVWGHPDDEAYLSAGLMAGAVDAGHRVVCVTATRGEAGFPEADERSMDERKALRSKELTECLAILGVREHRYLGYPDGGCGAVPDDEAATAIAAVIAEVQPDTVLTFGPDGGTGHQDHIAACRWTTMAFDRAAPAGSRLLYSTKTQQWDDRFLAGVDRNTIMMLDNLEAEVVEEAELAIWYSCDEEMLTRKVAALRSQASQVEPLVELVGLGFFKELVREEFYREQRPSDREFIERAKGWLPQHG